MKRQREYMKELDLSLLSTALPQSVATLSPHTDTLQGSSTVNSPCPQAKSQPLLMKAKQTHTCTHILPYLPKLHAHKVPSSLKTIQHNLS